MSHEPDAEGFPLFNSPSDLVISMENEGNGEEHGNNMANIVNSYLQVKAAKDRRIERLNSYLISKFIEKSEPNFEEFIKNVEVLLCEGANIETHCRHYGVTLLHLAAYNGDKDKVNFLISKGCKVDTRDNSGKEAIHIAAWQGHQAVLEELLKGNCDVNSVVQREQVNEISFPDSLDHSHSQIKEVWRGMESIPDDSTPLHIACSRRKTNCIEFLLNNGADTTYTDSMELRAVDVIGNMDEDNATSRLESDISIAQLILKFSNLPERVSSLGAESGLQSAPNVSDTFPINPDSITKLKVLCINNKFDDYVLDLLLNDFNNWKIESINDINLDESSLLLCAVMKEILEENKWLDVISFLLELNADTSLKNKSGDTVFHLTAAEGKLKILEDLLHVSNAKEIINYKNKDGFTPIHKAVENNRLDVVKLLKMNGADITISLPNGQTLLHTAAKKGHSVIFQLLLGYIGDDLKSKKEKEIRPHHIPLEKWNEDVIELLKTKDKKFLQRSLKIKNLLMGRVDGSSESLKNKGFTPLQIALENGNEDVVEEMLKTENKPLLLQLLLKDLLKIQDKDGWYPLQIAARNGHRNCVAMLLRAGVDVSLTQNDERRAESGIDIIMTNISEPIDLIIDTLDSFIKREDQEITLDFFFLQKKMENNSTENFLHFNENSRYKITADYSLVKQKTETTSKRESDINARELMVLESIIKNGSEELEETFFLHPLVQSFIYLKFQKIEKLFWINIFCFLLLVIYLSVLACERTYYHPISLFLLVPNCPFEIFKFLSQKPYLWKNFEFWIKIGVYLCLILMSVVYCVVARIQCEITFSAILAFGILLSWTEVLFMIAKYFKWGIYVHMFTKVAATVLKVLIMFLVLFFGFVFSFRALFQDNGPFNSLSSSIMTVFIMIFEQDHQSTIEDNIKNTTLKFWAQCLYLIFAVAVSVSVVNLMVGLAVSDITELMRKGKIMLLKKKTTFLGSLEDIYWIRDFIPSLPSKQKVDGSLPSPLRKAIEERVRRIKLNAAPHLN